MSRPSIVEEPPGVSRPWSGPFGYEDFPYVEVSFRNDAEGLTRRYKLRDQLPLTIDRAERLVRELLDSHTNPHPSFQPTELRDQITRHRFLVIDERTALVRFDDGESPESLNRSNRLSTAIFAAEQAISRSVSFLAARVCMIWEKVRTWINVLWQRLCCRPAPPPRQQVRTAPIVQALFSRHEVRRPRLHPRLGRKDPHQFHCRRTRRKNHPQNQAIPWKRQ